MGKTYDIKYEAEFVFINYFPRWKSEGDVQITGNSRLFV